MNAVRGLLRFGIVLGVMLLAFGFFQSTPIEQWAAQAHMLEDTLPWAAAAVVAVLVLGYIALFAERNDASDGL